MSARERGSQRNREGTPVDSSPPGFARRSPHPRGMNASRRGMSCKQLPIACRDVRVDAWASIGVHGLVNAATDDPLPVCGTPPLVDSWRANYPSNWRAWCLSN